MNIFALAAAGLMGLTTVVHVFLGGPEVNAPIQASELTPYLRAISGVIWHAISVILALFTVAYLWVAKFPNRPLEVLLIATQIGFAALFVFYGATMLGELKTMPQWTIFLLIPLLTLLQWRPKR